jgi:hypothetical protein
VTPPDTYDEALDALYAGAPDDFVSARNALAKELRKAGRRSEAEEVRALRKPSLSAWLANRLARTDPSAMEALLDAGERLRRTHQALLGGGDADDFQRSRQDLREAIRRLLEAARNTAADEGRTVSESIFERVATTLEAAALDDEAREVLRRGRLIDDLELPGFELLSPAPPPRRAPKREAARPRPAPKRDDARAVSRAERDAETAARAQRTAAAAARKRDLTEARQSLHSARADVRELRSQQREASRRADEAVRQAEQLETEARRLGEQLARAEQAVAESEDRLTHLLRSR